MIELKRKNDTLILFSQKNFYVRKTNTPIKLIILNYFQNFNLVTIQ